LAELTGWGFSEIMDELPFSAGLQIIDADLTAKGIPRIYARQAERVNFDVSAEIERALEECRNSNLNPTS
jgi:hypothetical protein